MKKSPLYTKIATALCFSLLSVHLCLGANADDKGATIYVKIPTEDTIEVEIEGSETIEALKKKIQDKKGFPPNRQHLMFADKQLEDDKTLASYNIIQGSTVDLISTLRLRRRSSSQSSDQDDLTLDQSTRVQQSLVEKKDEVPQIKDKKKNKDASNQSTASSNQVYVYIGVAAMIIIGMAIVTLFLKKEGQKKGSRTRT